MRKRGVLGASGRGRFAAPTAAFTLGTQVGVPTGTSLTATTGLPTHDATETLTLAHPVTGETVNRTVKVWRRRSWSATLDIEPPAGETWLFDECLFTVSGAFWAVSVSDTHGVQDQMQPLAVFRRCTFDGSRTSQRCLLGNCLWIIGCHLSRAADGWQSGAIAVGVDSNIIGDTAGGVDEHMDGFQNAGFGLTTLYHCWCTPGFGEGATQAVRFGTEFGPLANIDVRYCGLSAGGWTVGVGAADGVTFIGNRWTRAHGFGPADLRAPMTGLVWVDNKYFDGEVIPQPTPG